MVNAAGDQIRSTAKFYGWIEQSWRAWRLGGTGRRVDVFLKKNLLLLYTINGFAYVSVQTRPGRLFVNTYRPRFTATESRLSRRGFIFLVFFYPTVGQIPSKLLVLSGRRYQILEQLCRYWIILDNLKRKYRRKTFGKFSFMCYTHSNISKIFIGKKV